MKRRRGDRAPATAPPPVIVVDTPRPRRTRPAANAQPLEGPRTDEPRTPRTRTRPRRRGIGAAWSRIRKLLRPENTLNTFNTPYDKAADSNSLTLDASRSDHLVQFFLELTVERLSDIPLVLQDVHVMIRYKEPHRRSGAVLDSPTCVVDARTHEVVWNHRLDIGRLSIAVDEQTLFLRDRFLEFDVYFYSAERRREEVLGRVKVNMSPFAGKKLGERVRRSYLLYQCDVNCVLAISVVMRQVSGDRLFRVPEFRDPVEARVETGKRKRRVRRRKRSAKNDGVPPVPVEARSRGGGGGGGGGGEPTESTSSSSSSSAAGSSRSQDQRVEDEFVERKVSPGRLVSRMDALRRGSIGSSLRLSVKRPTRGRHVRPRSFDEILEEAAVPVVVDSHRRFDVPLLEVKTPNLIEDLISAHTPVGVTPCSLEESPPFNDSLSDDSEDGLSGRSLAAVPSSLVSDGDWSRAKLNEIIDDILLNYREEDWTIASGQV